MKKYLIEDRVVFDSHQMTLSHEDQSTDLTANESELLSMVLTGMATKAHVIQQVWTSKGIVVTESSYHQLVRALRQRLEEHGISASVIKTLPRQGLKFMGTAREQCHMTPESTTENSIDFGSRSAPPESHEHSDGFSLSSAGDEASQPGTPAIQSMNDRPVPAWRRALGYCDRAILVGIILWMGLLTWHTPTFKHFFGFQLARLIENDQRQVGVNNSNLKLLATIGVRPRPDERVYEISNGENRWLSICRESSDDVNDHCKAYAMKDIPMP